MVRPAALSTRCGFRNGCRIADDTGNVDVQWIARSDQVRFTSR